MNSAAESHNIQKIRTAVCGALGRMGREVVAAVLADPQLELVGVADFNAASSDLHLNIPIDASLEDMLVRAKPEVCVDFTHPSAVFANAKMMLCAGCRPVIGTTGLTPEQLTVLEKKADAQNLSVLVIPNFALGAVLMMKFAEMASQYFEHAEIIELHHNQKADAPSGTALITAEKMEKVRKMAGSPVFGLDNIQETHVHAGARGTVREDSGLHIHSVRLPGLVAHQEVIFGAPGQLLTLRHDSFDRKSFMPGVCLAVKKALGVKGMIYGLDSLL